MYKNPDWPFLYFKAPISVHRGFLNCKKFPKDWILRLLNWEVFGQDTSNKYYYKYYCTPPACSRVSVLTWMGEDEHCLLACSASSTCSAAQSVDYASFFLSFRTIFVFSKRAKLLFSSLSSVLTSIDRKNDSSYSVWDSSSSLIFTYKKVTKIGMDLICYPSTALHIRLKA